MTLNSIKKVMVLLAPGFEETETIIPVDILRRSGARVTLAGLQSGPIEGSRGVFILSDHNLNDLNHMDYDLVVLPGGQPGTSNLQKDERVLKLLRSMHSRGKLIAAICAAPIVLQSAGILEGQALTSHPSVKEHLHSIKFSENRVVVDQNIITSQGPGTAMEFSMKLVEFLFDQDRVEKVNKQFLAKL
tara:strand:+ start:146 stop:709 length:564 start_codon:yes stop_codon:yes gene_type:complete